MTTRAPAASSSSSSSSPPSSPASSRKSSSSALLCSKAATWTSRGLGSRIFGAGRRTTASGCMLTGAASHSSSRAWVRPCSPSGGRQAGCGEGGGTVAGRLGITIPAEEQAAEHPQNLLTRGKFSDLAEVQTSFLDTARVGADRSGGQDPGPLAGPGLRLSAGTCGGGRRILQCAVVSPGEAVVRSPDLQIGSSGPE